MQNQTLPLNIEKIFSENSTPDAVFSALLPALGEVLQCDRVFIYLRYPYTCMGKVPYCWRRSPNYPEVFDADWKPEPESLPSEDPMFAAALRTDPSIFVEDVQTASPNVLNRDFEAQNFGHRALIHAHLCWDEQLWGVLQPCVFDRPRVWTQADRSLIHAIVDKITPLAVAYVKANQV